MEHQRQLAALLLELKPATFIGLEGQTEIIESANNLMQAIRSDVPGWQSLHKAIEEISRCHAVAPSIRNQARRIIEFWVPL